MYTHTHLLGLVMRVIITDKEFFFLLELAIEDFRADNLRDV